MRLPDTIYYKDELNDEFSSADIKAKEIDGDYVYVRTSPWSKFTRFFWYRIFATPLAFLYSKIVLGQKVSGDNPLKRHRGGCFVYINHTQQVGDPFIPNVVMFPKNGYFIVHPDNISMPVLGKVTPSMGAIPLPGTLEAHRHFLDALEKRIGEGAAVCVYPEAHIWPYYTKIRPFPDTSFAYPVKYGVPAFTITNTYQKRRFSKKPRVVSYVDGPFYPDRDGADASAREKRKELRDEVYGTMCSRAENSTVEYIRYIKKED